MDMPQPQEASVDYLIVDYENMEHFEKFKEFYEKIYLPNFPNPEENVTLESFFEIGKFMETRNDCKFFMILAYYEKEIVGGIIGDYIAETNSLYLQFIVISENKRRIHLGTKLIQKLVEAANEEAHRYDPTRTKIDDIFLEVENPDEVEKCCEEESRQRLRFWKKKGGYKLDMIYIQPPSGFDKPPCYCLNLCIIPYSQPEKKFIKKEKVLRYLELIFLYDFKVCNGLDGKKELKEMSDKIGEKDNIEILSLV